MLKAFKNWYHFKLLKDLFLIQFVTPKIIFIMGNNILSVNTGFRTGHL